jgi:stage V sporulation protein B
MLIGDDGMGLFQMAYPVYSTLLAISTAGIPIAISKLVAENLAHGNYRGAYKIFRVALAIMALSGLFVSAALYLGAGYITRTITQDPRAYYPLISISPAIFLVTVMAAYRGFFQGQQQMLPTALSQIAEQIGRVAVALLLVVALLPMGLEYAAAGASFGAAAGAFFGLAFLLVLWQRQKKDFTRHLHAQKTKDTGSAGGMIGQIIALSVPITLGGLVMPLITIVDLSLVPQRLHAAGFADRATALYGQLAGMASPIVHIPTIITVALAISLVPAISEALALNKRKMIRERSYLAFRMTLLLGLPSAFGLFLLAEPITVLLFNNAEAGRVLAVMSLGVVFLTLFQTTSAILQGLGKTMDPVVSLFWGALIKTVLTWYLTALPSLHIVGAALATVIGFGVAAFLNVFRVQHLTGMELKPMESICKPLAASLAMSAAVLLLYQRLSMLHNLLGLTAANGVATLLAVAAGVFVYAVVLFFLGGIQREDLLALPKAGPALVRIAQRLHILRG